MAATAISLQFRRRRRNTSILLFQNPSSLRLFSSSSSSIPDPPNNSDDQTPSPPSQSQTSFSSYFSDLKSSLKQQQQQQQPQQQPSPPYQRQPAPPNQRPQFSFQQNPNRGPAAAGPTSKANTFGEIRKNLSEFRNLTAAPPPKGLNSPPPRPNQTVSFQELYRKNVMARNGSPNNTGSSSEGGKLSYDMIRESLKQMRQKKPVEENKRNDFSGGTNSLFGPAKLTSVYGGTEALPSKVFGKESKRKDGEPGEMKTKFLKMYTYGDLGEKLKMLRPEEAKKNTGKWFSLKELSERLIKLREFDVKEVESRSTPLSAIRESLEKLSLQDEEKKKSSYHRIEMLGQLGGTPNYMLSPPKENLVEKYFHPDNMSSAEKMKIELQKVRDEFKMSESDCGSSRVQVAQLTTKIKHLSTTLHKKDKHSRKGLQAMVQRRKKLLKYMRRTDWDSYCLVLDKLGLRDNPDYKN